MLENNILRTLCIYPLSRFCKGQIFNFDRKAFITTIVDFRKKHRISPMWCGERTTNHELIPGASHKIFKMSSSNATASPCIK